MLNLPSLVISHILGAETTFFMRGCGLGYSTGQQRRENKLSDAPSTPINFGALTGSREGLEGKSQGDLEVTITAEPWRTC